MNTMVHIHLIGQPIRKGSIYSNYNNVFLDYF